MRLPKIVPLIVAVSSGGLVASAGAATPAPADGVMAAPLPPLATSAQARGPRASQRRDADALALVNTATRRVLRREPECRLDSAAPQKSVFSDADPSSALLSMLGVFRRSPTPAELTAGRTAEPEFDARPELIYSRYVRILQRGRYKITSPLPNLGLDVAVLAGCERKVHAEIPRAGRRAPKPLVRRALVLHDEFRRAERQRLPSSRTRTGDELSLTVSHGRGSGGSSGFSLEQLRRHGLTVSTGGQGPRERGGRVFALVPDGVRTVQARYGRLSFDPFRGGLRARAERFIKTARVVDNLASYAEPRGGANYPLQITWRRADGSVVRVFRRG